MNEVQKKGLDFIEEYRIAKTEAVNEKKKELMKIRFLKRIQDVRDGKAKNFCLAKNPGQLPIDSKTNDTIMYRNLKRSLFKHLIKQPFDEKNRKSNGGSKSGSSQDSSDSDKT